MAVRTPRPPARPLDISDDAWSEAVRREATLRSLATSATRDRVVVKVAADALGLSSAQVYRLIGQFREKPVTGSLVVTKPGPKNGARLLPFAVERRIEQAIDDIFRSRERPAMAKLTRDLRKDCSTSGLKPPSRKAIQARVSARSLREIVQAREGSEAARQRFVPVRPGLRPRHPLAVVQIDHTKVDIQLVDDPARAVLGRPWLTLLLDVFSRSVPGFSLSFDAPSAAGVAIAIAQGMLPKAKWLTRNALDLAWPMHGMAQSLHLDNGPEFHSRALKRGCQQHGMRIDYRPPATPRFGGHIERLMGTLMTRVHALPGTTSSKCDCARRVPVRAESRPDAARVRTHLRARDSRAVSQRGTFRAGDDSGRRLGRRCHGQQRRQAPPDPAAFVLDFLPFEERVVRRDGVRLFNVTYFDGTLAPLLDRNERSIRVKYDPRDMSAVFVELPDGGHLRVPCADLGRPPVTLWEQQAATRILRATGRRSVDEAAIFAAIEEQRRVLAAAQASSKAARRATARQPDRRSVSTDLQQAAAAEMAAIEVAGDDDGRVPSVAEGEAWKTEFLS